MSTDAQQRDWLTVREVARELRLHISAVYRAVERASSKRFDSPNQLPSASTAASSTRPSAPPKKQRRMFARELDKSGATLRFDDRDGRTLVARIALTARLRSLKRSVVPDLSSSRANIRLCFLGGALGRVEDAAVDADGACFGESKRLELAFDGAVDGRDVESELSCDFSDSQPVALLCVCAHSLQA